jgi:hypothetical protein
VVLFVNIYSSQLVQLYELLRQYEPLSKEIIQQCWNVLNDSSGCKGFTVLTEINHMDNRFIHEFLHFRAVPCYLCYTLLYTQVNITFILKLPVPCPMGTISCVPGSKAAGVWKLTTLLYVRVWPRLWMSPTGLRDVVFKPRNSFKTCLKHFTRCVMMKHWPISLHTVRKLLYSYTGIYNRHMKILFNTQEICSVLLSTRGYDVHSEICRQTMPY